MKTRKYQNFRACGGLTQTILTVITKNSSNFNFFDKNRREAAKFFGGVFLIKIAAKRRNFFVGKNSRFSSNQIKNTVLTLSPSETLIAG